MSILLSLQAVGAQTAEQMPDLTAVTAPTEAEINVIDLAFKGGWIMVVLLLLSLMACYIFIQRLMVIRRAGKEDETFMNRIKDYIHEGKVDSALNLCRSTNTPSARMIEKGITRLGRPMNDVLVAIENVGNLEIAKLEKGFPLIATTAAGAPMLGFLGTVTGMVRAFFDMANAGTNVDVTLLSGGIPLDENFNITDDTRMRAALPTLKKILADGGSVIIGSHLGRPKGPADKFSLKHILKHLEELLGVEVQFANDCMGEEAAVKAAALQPGEVLLLENLRFYAEEEGKPRGLAEDATDEEKKAAKAAVKESQKEFTKKLASYADCYVNDAFGTAHRAHASTALIAKYFDKDNKMFGYLMEKEVKAVDKVLNDIQRPFTAIMGGSKVSSKIEIIENLLNKVDNLIIAGGMTYTFTKAMGGKIGISICEDDKLDLALDLVKKAKEKGVNLVLAVDAKIADSFSNDANTKFCPVDEIPDGWEGLDIGPETEKIFADVIKNSKTILWNGPTGVFEFENFTHGSRAVGEAIVEATKNGAFSLVGGGDSVACVNKFGLASGVSYVSTGGGALLEAIEGKILPGIAAINE